jgi:hypothetical protein
MLAKDQQVIVKVRLSRGQIPRRMGARGHNLDVPIAIAFTNDFVFVSHALVICNAIQQKSGADSGGQGSSANQSHLGGTIGNI